MSTGSWPLDLFWLLSGATLLFAVGAYVVGQVRQHRAAQREWPRESRGGDDHDE